MSMDRSRKDSSLLVTLSQQRHRVSLARTPSVKFAFLHQAHFTLQHVEHHLAVASKDKFEMVDGFI
jgi:hypothetical protein